MLWRQVPDTLDVLDSPHTDGPALTEAGFGHAGPYRTWIGRFRARIDTRCRFYDEAEIDQIQRLYGDMTQKSPFAWTCDKLATA